MRSEASTLTSLSFFLFSLFVCLQYLYRYWWVSATAPAAVKLTTEDAKEKAWADLCKKADKDNGGLDCLAQWEAAVTAFKQDSFARLPACVVEAFRSTTYTRPDSDNTFEDSAICFDKFVWWGKEDTMFSFHGTKKKPKDMVKLKPSIFKRVKDDLCEITDGINNMRAPDV